MKDFLDSVADSTSLINTVFNVDDVYNILSGEIGSTDSGDVQSISLKRQIAQKVTMNNRSKLGLYSALSLLNDKALNDIVDEATLELQEKIDMNNVQFEKHAAITEIVGLSLPYEDEEQDSNVDLIGKSDEAEKIEKENIVESDEDVYASKQMMSTISEPENESNIQLQSFKTLQFNSLCIRRPDAEQKLEEKGKFLLQDVDMEKLIHPQEFSTGSVDNDNDNDNDNNNDNNDNDKNDSPNPSSLDI